MTNTPKQGAEPVAFVNLERWLSGEAWPDDCFSEVAIDDQKTPLYTAPPPDLAAGMEAAAKICDQIARPEGLPIPGSKKEYYVDDGVGCAAAIRAAIPQAGGFVVVPRDQLEHWGEYWNGSANERAMSDALEHILGEVSDLLAAATKGGK